MNRLPLALGSLLLIIFYIIGLVGIGFTDHEAFVKLTPINLLVSLGIILWYQPKWTLQVVFFLFVCYLVGFTVEVVGVNTGLLFGNYQYGTVLGIKVWSTPLIIGVNWILLIYSTGMCSNFFLQKINHLQKALLGATIMVVLDVLIEPVAIALDFWSWESGVVPLQNYLMWWIVSFALLYAFHFSLPNMQNKVARTLLLLQFCFFGSLNVL
ncbi:MAG: carotenoid biosynthesis protein [Saprospiraceae bacterium]|nr:carotenoid biosynthesis protein [Saprospiraceae bacterium]